MDDLRNLKDYSPADMEAAQSIVSGILLKLLRRDLSPLRSWVDNLAENRLNQLVNYLLKQVFERCHCTFDYQCSNGRHFILLVEPGRKGLLLKPGEVSAVSISADAIAVLPKLAEGVKPIVETLKFGLTDMELGFAKNQDLWATHF